MVACLLAKVGLHLAVVACLLAKVTHHLAVVACLLAKVRLLLAEVNCLLCKRLLHGEHLKAAKTQKYSPPGANPGNSRTKHVKYRYRGVQPAGKVKDIIG